MKLLGTTITGLGLPDICHVQHVHVVFWVFAPSESLSSTETNTFMSEDQSGAHPNTFPRSPPACLPLQLKCFYWCFANASVCCRGLIYLLKEILDLTGTNPTVLKRLKQNQRTVSSRKLQTGSFPSCSEGIWKHRSCQQYKLGVQMLTYLDVHPLIWANISKIFPHSHVSSSPVQLRRVVPPHLLPHRRAHLFPDSCGAPPGSLWGRHSHEQHQVPLQQQPNTGGARHTVGRVRRLERELFWRGNLRHWDQDGGIPVGPWWLHPQWRALPLLCQISTGKRGGVITVTCGFI